MSATKDSHPMARLWVLGFEVDSFASGATVLTLDSATKLLSYAKDDLPMLVVGIRSNATAYGYGEQSENKQVKSAVAQLLKQKSAVKVGTRADMEAGIAKLGMQPGVTYSNQYQLPYSRRVENGVDYYFFSGSSATVYVDANVMIPRTAGQLHLFSILSPCSIVQAPLYNIEKDDRICLQSESCNGLKHTHNTRKSWVTE